MSRPTNDMIAKAVGEAINKTPERSNYTLVMSVISDALRGLYNGQPPTKPPAHCPNDISPYSYCPLLFSCADDMVGKLIETLAVEIKRVNGLPMSITTGEEAQALDRYIGEITAYMNGRADGIIRALKAQK